MKTTFDRNKQYDANKVLMLVNKVYEHMSKVQDDFYRIWYLDKAADYQMSISLAKYLKNDAELAPILFNATKRSGYFNTIDDRILRHTWTAVQLYWSDKTARCFIVDPMLFIAGSEEKLAELKDGLKKNDEASIREILNHFPPKNIYKNESTFFIFQPTDARYNRYLSINEVIDRLD